MPFIFFYLVKVDELKRAYLSARSEGTDVRALCVINPGNPTGNTLSEWNVREVIQFCRDHRLVLIADEVYQTNVYHLEKPFVSFKKVLKRYAGGSLWGGRMVEYVSIIA
jgi:alanine transaminase